MKLYHFMFDAPVDQACSVFMRVATGLILLSAFTAQWADYLLLFSPAGLVDPALLQLHAPPTFPTVQQLVIYGGHVLHVDDHTIVVAIGILYLLLCILLVLGIQAIPTCIALLLLHASLYTAQPQLAYGADQFGSIALFYCLLFALCVRWGITWLRPCLRVFQLHLCIAYFFSGFDKLLGHTWRNGEALYKALSLPHFQPILHLDMAALADYPLLFIAVGWAVILLELCYPVGIWLRRTHRIYLIAIIALHVGIALFIGLHHFSALMIALNIGAFYFDPPRGIAYQKETAKRLTNHPLPRGLVADKSMSLPDRAIQRKEVK